MWPEYKRAYKAAFLQHTSRFVLVFDLRDLTMPGFDVIAKKKRLLKWVKPYTVRKMLGVVVLTAYPQVKDIVTGLVRAGGQVAPFYAFTDIQEALVPVGRMVAVIRHQQTPTAAAGQGLTWAQVPFSTVAAVVLVSVIRMLPHVLFHREQ